MITFFNWVISKVVGFDKAAFCVRISHFVSPHFALHVLAPTGPA
jgi:hypothetical protein